MTVKRRTRWIVTLVIGGALSLWVAPAGADTVTFQQGAANAFTTGAYAGTGDNAIYYYAGSTTKNYGSSNLIDSGPAIVGTQIKRSVIRFDLSDFADAYGEVTSVTLRLHVGGTYQASSAIKTLQVYAISQDNAGWQEGTVNGVAQIGSSSWDNLANPSTAWSGGGGLGDSGDGYAATPLASATWNNATTGALDLTFAGTTAELTALIDSFTNSATNAGLLLRDADETSVAGMIRFYSSEAAYFAITPELIIGYTAVPEPATMVVLGLGGVGLLWRRKRHVKTNDD